MVNIFSQSLFALVSLFVDLSLLPVSLSLCVCCLLDLCLGGVATVTNHHTMDGASKVALAVKNPPANAGDRRHGSVPGLGKIPWGRAWQPTPVFLPGQRSLVPTVHRAAKSQTRLK